MPIFRRLSTSLAAFALLSFTGVAQANDATWGGDGADLVPIKEKRIRMAAEDILLEQTFTSGQGHRWQVVARYTFENPTDEAITVKMGFPERFCDEEQECSGPHKRFTFWDMKTTVDGKPVKVEVGKVSKKEETWAPQLGRVHLFEVAFAPKSTVEVEHRYYHGASGSFMGDQNLTYITKTGSLWNGPIGKARFTVRVPERPWGFTFPQEYGLKSYTTQQVEPAEGAAAQKKGKKYVTELIFEQENWTPTQDLELFLDSAWSYGNSWDVQTFCPQAHPALLEDNALEEPTLAKAEAAFGKLTDEQLRICRNLPYARHGYTFKDAALSKHFYSPVAKVTNYLGSKDEPKDTYRRLNFQVNPHYSEDQLSRDELNYIKLIGLLQADRKAKAAK